MENETPTLQGGKLNPEWSVGVFIMTMPQHWDANKAERGEYHREDATVAGNAETIQVYITL